MSFNIRSAVKANIAGNSQDQLQETIVDAIQNGEEKMLPGLGYLFEVIWQHSSNDQQKEMLSSLESGLKQ